MPYKIGAQQSFNTYISVLCLKTLLIPVTFRVIILSIASVRSL